MMKVTDRISPRYDDIGRVFVPQICALPGILDNISREGCKVLYTLPVDIDMDNDYEVKITFARAAGSGQLSLMCHPQWKREENGATEIGFRILPSTDFSKLAKYIDDLNADVSSDPLYDELSNSSVRII